MYLLTFQSQAPTYTDTHFTQIHTLWLRSSTTLQSLLKVALITSSCRYLFYLTPATVPAFFDIHILQHTTVSGCDSTLVAHSRLLPSLITRKPAISQQRLGITIQVHKRVPPAPEQTLQSILIKMSPLATRGR